MTKHPMRYVVGDSGRTYKITTEYGIRTRYFIIDGDIVKLPSHPKKHRPATIEEVTAAKLQGLV